MTSLVGALAEAWQELRVHRLRVLLSLIVVAISVAAFTSVIALGLMLSQNFQEQAERGSGRPAAVSFMAGLGGEADQADQAATSVALTHAAERYGVEWYGRQAYANVFAPGADCMSVQAVDPDYGVMHRVRMVEGSWFSETDGGRFVPAIVISENWWKALGSPALVTHPTVDLTFQSYSMTDPNLPPTETRTTGVVTGIAVGDAGPDCFTGYVLFDTAVQLLGDDLYQQTQYEAWIPPGDAEPLMDAMKQAIAAELPEGSTVDAYRSDYAFMIEQQGGGDPFALGFTIAGVIAALVMGLGALGLLNITLVTVRYRIREIGVRRSFGATGARVFFSVMLESVVATVLAGIVGIILAIFLLRLPIVTDTVLYGVQDVPSFPMGAALVGLLASAIVGALAGLLPALVAVKVKPIDAIRY